jgi:hypothetical protein
MSSKNVDILYTMVAEAFQDQKQNYSSHWRIQTGLHDDDNDDDSFLQ